MLEIKNLCVNRSKREVLEGISLTVERGKFYAVTGRNGAGKSTLLGCVSGTVKYEGKIELCNKDIKEYTAKERARLVSYLPQSLAAVPFTVGDLVGFGRNPYGDTDTQKGRAEAEKAMADAGISRLSQKAVDGISGGERQLSYFAMCLCQYAPLMLLDEPVNNCDLEHAVRLLDTVKNECVKGKSALCVLHDLSLAVKYADGIIIIDEGRCVFSGTTEECLEKKMIEETFGVVRRNADGEIFFSANFPTKTIDF